MYIKASLVIFHVIYGSPSCHSFSFHFGGNKSSKPFKPGGSGKEVREVYEVTPSCRAGYVCGPIRSLAHDSIMPNVNPWVPAESFFWAQSLAWVVFQWVALFFVWKIFFFRFFHWPHLGRWRRNQNGNDFGGLAWKNVGKGSPTSWKTTQQPEHPIGKLAKLCPWVVPWFSRTRFFTLTIVAPQKMSEGDVEAEAHPCLWCDDDDDDDDDDDADVTFP